MQRVVFRTGITAIAAATALTSMALPGQAAPTGSFLYVSPTGAPSGDDSSCAAASHSTIQSALDDVTAGGTVVVCTGTYAESATISKAYVSLRGESGAVVDATGSPYGIGIAADHVTVDGMTVRNATAVDPLPGDGIVTAGLVNGQPAIGNFATITNNVTTDNEGAGIDIESSSGNTVNGNRSVRNEVGINVSNDLGPGSKDNVISNNVASKNPLGCGIVLADHTGSGVTGSRVIGNTLNRNGLGSDPDSEFGSTGSGIIIAGGDGATLTDTLVRGNTFNRNGHGGIALHAHAPNSDFSGIRLVGNLIGKNNLREDYKAPFTTGIYLGNASSMTIRVASNLIHDNVVGVFTAGDITVKGKRTNAFDDVKRHFDGVRKYAG